MIGAMCVRDLVCRLTQPDIPISNSTYVILGSSILIMGQVDFIFTHVHYFVEFIIPQLEKASLLNDWVSFARFVVSTC